MAMIEYIKKDTIVHGLNPITKIFLLVAFWAVALVMFDLVSVILIVIVSVVLWRLSGIPLSVLRKVFVLLSVVFVVYILVNGFMYFRGKTPIFFVLGHPFTWEGLIFGITISLKVLAVVCLVPVLTMTTPMSKLMAAMAKMKVPYKFVFTFGMAIRLTPLIDQVYHEIIDAQKLRGHDVDSMGLIKKIRKGYLPIFVPLILTLLRRSSDMDVAIESRAFGAPVKRTYLEEMGFHAWDFVFMGVTVIIAGSLLTYSFLYGSLTLGVLPV